MKKLLFLIGCFFIVVTLGLPDGVNIHTGVKSSPFYFIYWLAFPILDFLENVVVYFWVWYLLFLLFFQKIKKISYRRMEIKINECVISDFWHVLLINGLHEIHRNARSTHPIQRVDTN